MGSKRAPKGSVNSVRSVREKPSQRERKNPQQFVVYHLIARMLSIPHRKARKNRTHRVKNK